MRFERLEYKLKRLLRKTFTERERMTTSYKMMFRDFTNEEIENELTKCENWCASNRKKLSWARFWNWLKKSREFRGAKSTDTEDYERSRTRDILGRG